MVELILGLDEAGKGPVMGPMALAGCLIEKESSKLGLDEKNVHVKFGPTFLDTAGVEKIPNGNYEILLSENYQDAFTLRHELYHIYKKHFEDKSPSVTRLFLRESQSTLYGLFRIKI